MNLIAMLMLAADLNGQPLPDVVLLDFTAGYCQPCQQMVPILQEMESGGFPIRKIDITENPDISRKYKVDRIPTLILLVEGQEARRFVGLTAGTELRCAMNDAARKLDMKRKPVGAAPVAEKKSSPQPQPEPKSDGRSSAESFTDFADRQPPRSRAQAEADSPTAGIRGVFDRMKRGLVGNGETPGRNEMERPDFRGQSPSDGMPETFNDSLPMKATVRVWLDDGEFRDVGTGTIVHSTTGQSTILTCAHIFKKVSADAKVVVEAFRDGKVLKYPATVLGGDHESDVAFLRIQNRSPLPVVPLSSPRSDLQPDQRVFSVGCNAGNLPTQLSMNIVKVDYFNGPHNIVCNIDPVQGRSGGGLFNSAGELIGVCSGAFRESKEGLYSGVRAVNQLVTQLKLTSLFTGETPAFAATAETDAAAEPSGPFAQEDDLFEQMFEDKTRSFPDAATPAAAPAFEPDPLPEPAQPFPSSSPRTALASTNSGVLPTEITVIIDSKDPAKGKRVVVIPKPSPWLLELLTGESPTPPNTEIAAARTNSLSPTSKRQAARKPTPRRPSGTFRSASRSMIAGRPLPPVN